MNTVKKSQDRKNRELVFAFAIQNIGKVQDQTLFVLAIIDTKNLSACKTTQQH